MSLPRFRMAPSPTGYFHVGSARAALFNWLAARRAGGEFVLRIEDTDTQRNQAEATEGIYRAMEWLGLQWDGDPLLQSTRREAHVAAAMRLYEEGKAYWSDPVPPSLPGEKQYKGYRGEDRDKDLPHGEGRALRFRTPREGSTKVVDLVRGEPTFENDQIEDFVLLKGEGSPLFILANVCDDHFQGITHVVRGEDHLSNTPKYQMLWEALGFGDLPTFAHLPLLVNEKRQKLSKRRDKVAIEDYRDEGFLPEVMTNYLALLGWAPGNGVERFTIDEVVDEFDLADVNSSPAFFDVKKLTAFNGDTIRSLSDNEFVLLSQPWLRGEVEGVPVAWPAERYNDDVVAAMAPMVRERVSRLSEVPRYVDFMLCESTPIDQVSWEKEMTKEGVPTLLDGVISALSDPELEWSASDPPSPANGTLADGEKPLLAPIKEAVFGVGTGLGLNRKKTQAPVRVAITGRTVGPPLFEAMEILGRDNCVKRLRAARSALG